MTSWPGIRDDLVNAGATWLDEAVVRDGNWLTSRGPQDLPRFVHALLDHCAATSLAERRPQAARRASAPQRKTPPRFVVGALQRLPRRTVAGTAIAVGLLALYAMHARQRRSRPLALSWS